MRSGINMGMSTLHVRVCVRERERERERERAYCSYYICFLDQVSVYIPLRIINVISHSSASKTVHEVDGHLLMKSAYNCHLV